MSDINEIEIPSRKDEIRQVTPKDPMHEIEDKSTYHAKIKKSDSGTVLGAIPLNSRSSSNSSVTSTGQSSRRVTKKTTKKKRRMLVISIPVQVRLRNSSVTVIFAKVTFARNTD